MSYGVLREKELFLHFKTFILAFTCYSTSTLQPQITEMMLHAHIVMQPNRVGFPQK